MEEAAARADAGGTGAAAARSGFRQCDVRREFRRQHPGVEISLHEVTPRELIEGIIEQRIDLGFTRPLLDGVGGLPMHQEKLFDDELCVALPPKRPLAHETTPLPIRALAREPLVLMSRREAPWLFDTIIATYRKARLAPRIVATPDYMTTALMLVEAEVGLNIVPCTTGCYHQHVPVRFRPLVAGNVQIPLVMTWPRGVDSPTVTRFCELVRARRAEIAATTRLRH